MIVQPDVIYFGVATIQQIGCRQDTPIIALCLMTNREEPLLETGLHLIERANDGQYAYLATPNTDI